MSGQDNESRQTLPDPSQPEWLIRLVKDIRELNANDTFHSLLIEGMNEIINHQLDREDWQAHRVEHCQKVLKDIRLSCKDLGPPDKGWIWDSGPLLVHDETPFPMPWHGGWFPSHLHSSNDPSKVDSPSSYSIEQYIDERREHIEKILKETRLHNLNAGPPEDGWLWDEAPVRLPYIRPIDDTPGFWVPPALHQSNDPWIRTESTNIQALLLAAVHDHVHKAPMNHILCHLFKNSPLRLRQCKVLISIAPEYIHQRNDLEVFLNNVQKAAASISGEDTVGRQTVPAQDNAADLTKKLPTRLQLTAEEWTDILKKGLKDWEVQAIQLHIFGRKTQEETAQILTNKYYEKDKKIYKHYHVSRAKKKAIITAQACGLDLPQSVPTPGGKTVTVDPHEIDRGRRNDGRAKRQAAKMK